ARARGSEKTKSGADCRAWAVKDGKCIRHSQTREEASAQGRAGAAASRSSKLVKRAEVAQEQAKEALAALPADLVVKLDSPEGFSQTLQSVIIATADGRLSAAKSRAIAGVLKLHLDAANLAISAKLLELEKRLDQRKGVVR